MTLPLRTKRQTTARITTAHRNRTSQVQSNLNQARRRLADAILSSRLVCIQAARTLVPALALSLGSLTTQSASAQSEQWQPARLAPAPSAQALPSAMSDDRYLAGNRRVGSQSTQTQPATGSSEQLGNGVVLRWCRSKNAPEQQGQQITAAAAFASPSANTHTANRTNYPVARASSARGNPLRSNVQPAAYQDRVDPFQSRPAEGAPPLQGAAPQLPDFGSGATPDLRTPDLGAPDLGNPNIAAPSFSMPNTGGDIPQGLGSTPGQDPLAAPESAPAPGGAVPEVVPNVAPEPSPFDRGDDFNSRRSDDLMDEDPVDDAADRDSDRDAPLGMASCNTMRERMNARPISEMKLNPSPKYGNGMRLDYGDADRARKAFADTTKSREWYDYLGRKIATGRFVDMKNNTIYIDDVGKISTVHYLDLSDRDTEYVSLAWKIPGRCGTGYEPFEERSFIPTQFQWTASGLCHKPAYFEQPQLERYGHSVGPVLQPLISSAKFFTDIAILPYKMGIHPPNECQYSLGYIRPGNCAPYMMQPFPWSLRGAAVQAGVVTGAAALIP